MTPMGIDRTGAVTSVGRNVAQTMGSLRAGLARSTELGLLDPDGAPLRAYPAPLATGLGSGVARLIGLGGIALAECVADDPEPFPLALCYPGQEALPYDPMAVVRGMRSAVPMLDPDRTRIVRGGHAAIGSALVLASELLRESPVCYVGAVDTLIDSARIERLMAAERLLSERTPDGFIPGEGAAFLRLTLAPATVQIVGVGIEHETATRNAGKATGRGQARAARGALAEAGARIEDVDLMVADLTGERHRFYETALAMARLRPSPSPKQGVRRASFGTSLGEVGCALGAISVAYLATALSRGWDGAPSLALYVGADDLTSRTAVLVRSSPRGR
jgi:3-oxoacyl-[acyl-carrier-protein] synthase-1